MAGYLLDDQSIARLATLLREYEAGNLANRDRNVMPRSGPSYPIMHVVRVTSTTPTSGYYPGSLMTYDASIDTWTDDVDIKIKDINGGVPIVQRYLGRYAGINSYGDPVYMLDLSGTTGTTTTCSVLTYDYVSAISCVDGTITPVYTTVCVPCAYFCTTTTTSSSSTTTTTTSTSAPTTTTTSTSGTTTTTTTPCDIGGPSGYVSYYWNGTMWVFSGYFCAPGYAPPVPPTTPGSYYGEALYLCCELL